MAETLTTLGQKLDTVIRKLNLLIDKANVQRGQFDTLARNLDARGAQIMAGLTSIADALTEAEATLMAELTQIAEALANQPSPQEVDALAMRVTALKDAIANIIPG